jgi:hypothetical protein
MAKFSERYGYVSPKSVLIREEMPTEIVNAICTCYDLLKENFIGSDIYSEIEVFLWCNFLNQRFANYRRSTVVATDYIESDSNPWYKKLDLIEETLYCLFSLQYIEDTAEFIGSLNEEFKRLNYAYRIIENKVVEITSEEEIAEIETALTNPSNGVKEHLRTALELLSKRPEGDYRNSIKESISAVEVIVREITGSNTLNFAELERNGIALPSVLRQAFEKLYGYTNDKSTGIRHGLIDDINAPGADEAIFMLVSCSAFINYLTKKRA